MAAGTLRYWTKRTTWCVVSRSPDRLSRAASCPAFVNNSADRGCTTLAGRRASRCATAYTAAERHPGGGTDDQDIGQTDHRLGDLGQ